MSHTFESVLAIYNAKAEAAGHPSGARVDDWRAAIARAIVERDAPALKVICNGCNPVALSVFGEVAGIKPPRTQRDQWKAVKAFCNYSDEQDAAAEATRKADLDAKSAAFDMKCALGAAEAFKVRDEDGTVINGREWLERRMASGFSSLRGSKRGAVTVYDLMKPQCSTFYRLTARGWAPVAALARAMAASGKLTVTTV